LISPASTHPLAVVKYPRVRNRPVSPLSVPWFDLVALYAHVMNSPVVPQRRLHVVVEPSGNIRWLVFITAARIHRNPRALWYFSPPPSLARPNSDGAFGHGTVGTLVCMCDLKCMRLISEVACRHPSRHVCWCVRACVRLGRLRSG
jgi:hypothetical protein